MKAAFKLIVLASALLVSACGPQAEEQALEPLSPEAGAQTGDEIVFDTVVTVEPNGVASSRQVPISLSERLAQENKRAQIAALIAAGSPVAEAELAVRSQTGTSNITLDTACGGASWWGYDQTNQTGNRICFKTTNGKNGWVDLNDFCYWGPNPCVTWAGHIVSAWTGAKNSEMTRTIGGAWQDVSPYVRVGNIAVAPVGTILLWCPNVNAPCPG